MILEHALEIDEVEVLLWTNDKWSNLVFLFLLSMPGITVNLSYNTSAGKNTLLTVLFPNNYPVLLHLDHIGTIKKCINT